MARTAEQICAVAAVDLTSGDPEQALLGVVRGLAIKPSSPSCRRIEHLARTALRRERIETR